MPIVKVDGRRFLDSGTIVVSGDAVVEIRVAPDFLETKHEIALKFRTQGSEPRVRFGNPRPDRTVVHFADFPMDTVTSSGGVKIGEIGPHMLWLAFVIEPFNPAPGDVRRLSYTLYAGPKE